MQDAMWSFVELIYRNQGPESDQDWLTDELMEEARRAARPRRRQVEGRLHGPGDASRSSSSDRVAGAGGQGRRDAHLRDPRPERREDRQRRRRACPSSRRRWPRWVPRLEQRVARRAVAADRASGLWRSRASASRATSRRFGAGGESPACVVGGGCTTVQESEYSELAGHPGRGPGPGGLRGAARRGPPARPAGAGARPVHGLVGVGFSAWLTYAELVLIEAICAWCVTSAVLITLALILTAVRAARAGSGPESEGTARRSAPDPSPQGPTPPATPG